MSLEEHEPPELVRLYGTSASFPMEADVSSSSCARRPSVNGSRSATTGWILPSRSSSSSARKSSRNHGMPPEWKVAYCAPGVSDWAVATE